MGWVDDLLGALFMTTISEAEQIILSKWLSDWVVGSNPRTPTSFEEERIPSNVRPGEDPWVYLYVQEIPNGRRQDAHGTTGSRKFLQKSQIQIAIFTPSNAGTKLATDLAHEARTIFEGISLPPLQNFTKGDIVRVGSKPPEFQINVICPFEYVEVK